MDRNENKLDVVFFDDGTNYIKRKQGIIKKIKNGFIFFSEENGKIQLIPISRIVRVEKGENNE